jgi:hypothetical protein
VFAAAKDREGAQLSTLAHFFYLSQNMHDLRFAKQLLSSAEDLARIVMDFEDGQNVQQLLSKLHSKHDLLRKQVSRITGAAEVMSGVTSSVNLQHTCSAVSRSADQLWQLLQDLRSAAAALARGSGEQQAAAGAPGEAGTVQVEQLQALLHSLKQQLQQVLEAASTPEHAAAITAARHELMEHMLRQMEANMEGVLFLIGQWEAGIKEKATTCTQRQRFRDQLQHSGKQLEAMVGAYNKHASQGQPPRQQVQAQQLREGDIPWHFIGVQSAGQVPFKVKLSLVEARLKVQRSREQQQIVLGDMASFVAYYQQMAAELHVASCRYAGGAGLVVRFKQGLLQCWRQLYLAAEHFPKVTCGRFLMPAATAAGLSDSITRRPLLQATAALDAMRWKHCSQVQVQRYEQQRREVLQQHVLQLQGLREQSLKLLQFAGPQQQGARQQQQQQQQQQLDPTPQPAPQQQQQQQQPRPQQQQRRQQQHQQQVPRHQQQQQQRGGSQKRTMQDGQDTRGQQRTRTPRSSQQDQASSKRQRGQPNVAQDFQAAFPIAVAALRAEQAAAAALSGPAQEAREAAEAAGKAAGDAAMAASAALFAVQLAMARVHATPM